MRRLYFLIPDAECAASVVDRLLLARVPETRIHVVAREGTPLGSLPPAGLAQKTDLIAAIERGIELGGVTGSLAGLVAIAIPGAAVVSAGAMVLGLALAGGAVGAWASSMIGISVESPRLKPFAQAIERGKLLMMVDLPAHRVDEIRQMLQAAEPRLQIEGTEPDIPAFP